MAGGADLAGWTAPEINQECRAEYALYKQSRTDRYVRYFKDSSGLRQWTSPQSEGLGKRTSART